MPSLLAFSTRYAPWSCDRSSYDQHSYDQDLDITHRLLSPGGSDRRAHGAPRGLSDRIRIAPARPWHRVDRVHDGIIGETGDQVPVAVGLRNACHLKLEIADHLAALGHGERHRYDANEAKPATVRDRARLGIEQQAAILVKAPGGNLVNDGGIAGRQPDEITVAAQHDLADTRAARQ